MPAIWNVGNLNGIDNKKMSSKLTFEVGESFKGKIISEDSDNGVVVKLANGWEFSAEIVGEQSLKENGLVKFQVEGFENGKLKLKIVQDSTAKGNSVEGDIVGEFIKNEGLLKTDEDILKSMVKYKIPLTKENIAFVKSLVSFNEKVNSSESEIKNFIDSYIAAKGMNENSLETANVRENLKNFFESYKTLSKDDIMLFLENDIELNKENIDSYNKLFKSEDGFNDFFKNISKEIKDLNLPKQDMGELNVKMDFSKENIDSKSIDNNPFKPTINQVNALKIYDSNSLSKAKISMVSLLKSLGNTENEVIKDSLKNIIIDNKNNFTNSELKSIFNKLDDLSENDIFASIKNNLSEGESLSRENITKIISNIIGKEVNLSDEVVEKFNEILDFKFVDNTVSKLSNKEEINMQGNNLKSQDNILHEETGITLENIVNEDVLETNETSSKLESSKTVNQILDKAINNELKGLSSEIIKDGIKVKLDDIKEIIRDTLSRTQISNEHGEKIMDFIKSNLNDFKLLNSINNEYYYLDIPVNTNNQEYPCKLIIKDDRKGDKGIDRSNVRVVVAVKTLNLGTVDGYLTVHDKKLNVDLKCNKEFVNIIDNGTNILTKKLQDLGYSVNISVGKKDEEVSLTSCRMFFNDVNTSAIDTKV